MRISTGLLSALLAGVVGFAGVPRSAHSADWLELLGISSKAKSPLVIAVEAVYPGANAQVLADTVAAPIEQQVNGVEKMRYMRSRCSNDGTYRLHVTFTAGADADMAQVLVQNRVALALPVLPDAVQQRGITVKKKLPGAIMIVLLRSPDGSRNIRDLSHAATAQVKDELARLPGVAEVTCHGGIDCGVRVKLDAEKMAASKLTAGDVATAIQQQKVPAAAGPIGQPAVPPRKGFQITIPGPRLSDPAQVREIVLSAGAEGRVIRLKDVAAVEAETGAQGSQALFNGKPVVALAIYLLPGARPQEVRAAVQTKLVEVRSWLAQGVDADVGFDFTSILESGHLEPANRPATPRYVLLDVVEPGGATAERTRKALTRCQTLLHDVAGVQDVLALSENPLAAFPARPCLVVRLLPAGKTSPVGQTAPGREKVIATIRARLAAVAGATVRLRDLSAPGDFRGGGYPVAMAVEDRSLEQAHFGELAGRFAKRLRETKKLTDVWADSELTSRGCSLKSITPRRPARASRSTTSSAQSRSPAAGSLSTTRTASGRCGRCGSRSPASSRRTSANWRSAAPRGNWSRCRPSSRCARRRGPRSSTVSTCTRSWKSPPIRPPASRATRSTPSARRCSERSARNSRWAKRIG